VPFLPQILSRSALAASGATGDDLAGHFPPLTVAIFVAIFVFSVVVDLIQHREHKEVTARNAAGWTLFWIAVALGFAGWLAVYHGEDHPDWASLFLAGYVLEETLSIDNLVVFIAVFRYFNIRSGIQHRILYMGILGAIVFRALFVAVGTGLLRLMGPYAELIFGGFVLWAGLQMLRAAMTHDEHADEEPDYASQPLVRVFQRVFPVFPKLVGARFFLDRAEAEAAARDAGIELPPNAKRFMTPAFVCLLVIEGTDVMFAVDSVPAVLAITREPLVVYTAMMFAVLGLRSLYFIVEILTDRLVHLEKAVIGVLFFIGVKMLVGAAAHWGVTMPWWGALSEREQANASLAVVLGVLAAGVVASLASGPRRDAASGDQAPRA
jgi:tellurite resistance protein TerC